MKKIVVCGFMTTCPIAGVVWQHIHYIMGLKKLGYEPIYIEDSARHPYDPKNFETGEAAIPGLRRSSNFDGLIERDLRIPCRCMEI
jgi:hypothetical protein